MNSAQRIRCAIDTRKSSEEGLEQSFNSLHAQREACEAYNVTILRVWLRENDICTKSGGHFFRGRFARCCTTLFTTEASRQAILKAIARARLWYEQLTTGEAGSISQLAGMHGLSQRFLHAQMKLVQLSPQSIESLMNGTGSLPLSLGDLLKVIPINWREQGFNLPTKSA